MTFASQETSDSLGRPVDLFFFRYGTDVSEYFAYTDAEQSITVDHGGPEGAVTYEAVAIQRGQISSSGSLDNSTLSVTSSRDLALAELFRIYPPAQVVTLIIRQGHLADPDSEFNVVWSGRIIGSTRDRNSQVTYGCEPVSTSMRRPGLRRHYQYGCPHALYGPACQANQAAATVSATVSAISGATVTLAAGWNGAFDPTKFLGGMLIWTNAGGSIERRAILRISGDTLSANGVLRDLAVSDPISVVLGCARNMDDCATLHGNIVNFGGQPWIPTQNPIGTFNNYY